MKLAQFELITFLIIAIIAYFGSANEEDEKLDNYYNNLFLGFDIIDILENRRIVERYSSCLLGNIRCPGPAKVFKELFPHMLKTHCGRCTMDQKKAFDTTVEFLK
ncbi:GSCOCT00005604001.2-RA-CDS [Cotesia congregata]|uniref:Chemosensory protein 33.5604 n=1 Tax=Cotesia congregata TaxID=51543 RepID=A0A8J2HG69_COTCN|nr:GSCOCT00005604001.2-RA-CDS [Cotesia congregata]CAG5099643.1 Chemosensory protein 33.5604 [Cotesia congregata]